MSASFAIAPNFHCDGTWKDRLLVAEGNSWRAPHDAELAGLALDAPPEDPAGCSCLFSTPAHLRRRLWAMLTDEATEGAGDFVAFADEFAEFMAFKGLPLPDDAVAELVLQDANGRVDAAGLWALANLGEESILLAWPTLRLRLTSGEGCLIRTPSSPQVVPPAEEPNVLLTIRLG